MLAAEFCFGIVKQACKLNTERFVPLQMGQTNCSNKLQNYATSNSYITLKHTQTLIMHNRPNTYNTHILRK